MLEMFPFDSFFTLFTVMFVLVFIVIIFVWVGVLLRIFRRPSGTQSKEEEATTVVKEKEIIREIVKIRCPYCNNLYDEKYDKCPYCGGKRTP